MVGEVKHCKSLENLLLFLSSGLPSLVFLDKAGQHLVSLHLKLVHRLLALHADKQVNFCLCLGKELKLVCVSPVYRARSVIVVLKAQLPQQSSLQSCYNQSRLKGQSWGVRGGFDKRAHFSGFSGTLPLAKGA